VAVTRRALLDAAAHLLDAGGPEAVTLREVGARAGVSRNAPYRHFADKEGLLTAVAGESWDRLADALKSISATDSAPSTRLRQALMTFVELGRKRPHLYQLMFVIPESHLRWSCPMLWPLSAVRKAHRIASAVSTCV
jgi:AcrR family transcriptional regulator